jgi:hypothetical protein
MKKSNLALVLIALNALALSPAFANEGEGPCKQIKAACEAGGYTKGAHKKTGKGLFVDCMKKIMEGEAVEGVTVPAEEVAACKAKKEKHHAKKEAAAK